MAAEHEFGGALIGQRQIGGHFAGRLDAEQFNRQGPRDRKGRSLRDLDLKQRLFKYPCSYLIDSEAFNALPAEASKRVYIRLREILNDPGKDSAYARLTGGQRRAILEILIDTKPDLPDDWKDSLRSVTE